MIDLFTTDWPDKINIRVTPKAASNRVVSTRDNQGQLCVRVYVTVAPEHGKANAAVVDLLARTWGIAKSRILVTHGHACRDKVIHILSEK